MAACSPLKNVGGQGHLTVTTHFWCIMRECGLEPLQFNWFRAAMWFNNSLTRNSTQWKRLCMLKLSSARGLLIVGPSMFCQQWRAWHIPTLSNKICRILKPLTLIVLLWTSEPGICFPGSLFQRTSERAQ